MGIHKLPKGESIGRKETEAHGQLHHLEVGETWRIRRVEEWGA